ncbi:MAG TPA: class I SAM-dependent methyltransferase [Thermoplasmata archaeon]|nr:class I SAM-dependent methyltransferase [Thermoplasmata archaeon]HYB78703.1 class I SAM-dependent methyltransferase [Thermoplasmata archaeon]
MAEDKEFLDQLLRTELTWNTPLSESHASELLGRLELPSAHRILDLGCGRGRLLLQALGRAPTAHGVGVDRDRWELDQGRAAAKESGLGDRVTFVARDATKFDGTADRVLCIGAAHAWGATGSALARLRERTVPKGLLLFGDGFWARPPTRRLLEVFGNQESSVEAIADRARGAGWRVVHADSADPAEWDSFEESSYRGLERFARRAPDHPLSAAARDLAARRRKEYYEGYRGVLGFAYLILG